MKALAGNIAHELRTPLATIRMDAQSARPYLPDDLKDNIVNTVNHANIIIDMLLANLRSQPFAHNNFRHYSVNQCIQKALDSYPFQKDERKKLNFKSGPDFYFFGSDTLLIYVLYNLIKNALYSIARAMKGSIEVWLELHENGGILHFRDTGTGIAEKELPRIFDDFYSNKPNSVGNGLGLGFCSRVMTSFGGNIKATSLEGEYCEFILFFPEDN
jgi:signal transduction histidine kinase